MPCTTTSGLPMLGCCGGGLGIIFITWVYAGQGFRPAEYANALSWLAGRPDSDFPGANTDGRPKVRTYQRQSSGTIFEIDDPFGPSGSPSFYGTAMEYGAAREAIGGTVEGGKIRAFRFKWSFGASEFCRVDTQAATNNGDGIAQLNCAHFGITGGIDVLSGPMPANTGTGVVWRGDAFTEFVKTGATQMPVISSLGVRPVPACCGLS